MFLFELNIAKAVRYATSEGGHEIKYFHWARVDFSTGYDSDIPVVRAKARVIAEAMGPDYKCTLTKKSIPVSTEVEM